MERPGTSPYGPNAERATSWKLVATSAHGLARGPRRAAGPRASASCPMIRNCEKRCPHEVATSIPACGRGAHTPEARRLRRAHPCQPGVPWRPRPRRPGTTSMKSGEENAAGAHPPPTARRGGSEESSPSRRTPGPTRNAAGPIRVYLCLSVVPNALAHPARGHGGSAARKAALDPIRDNPQLFSPKAPANAGRKLEARGHLGPLRAVRAARPAKPFASSPASGTREAR